MAADSPTPPKGFGEFEPEGGNDDESIETVELSPGETLSGLVLNAYDGENDNGPWVRMKIKDEDRGVVVYFAKGDAKRAFYEGRVEEGEPIWVAMKTEEETFKDDDGETVTYNPTIVAFPEGGN